MRLVALALVVALSASTAGCFTCQDQLDVYWCHDATGRCDLQGETVVQWDPELGSLWPDIPRLMEQVDGGGHAHADWTRHQTEAFWEFWQVPADRDDKQVYFRDGEALYHIRVLAC